MRAKTKIIATLGPASSEAGILKKMIRNGLDVVRLNFSHGTAADHERKIELIRRLNRRMRRGIKIMQDLEGYRIRIGKLKRPVILKKNTIYYLTRNDKPKGARDIPFDYEGPLKSFNPGTEIYIDDGKLILQVKEIGRESLKVKSHSSGKIQSFKGVNAPGARLDFESLTEKDKRDIEVGITHRVEYLAQSFVRNAKDINIIRKITEKGNPGCLIYAKIENREALKNLDAIIKVSDGIIVARGDLGICVPLYEVPEVQKEIVRRCKRFKKPAVIATQMLDSMTSNPMPTRAEVTDVANAIFDGASFLLLSGETAVGKYPDKAVGFMNDIIKSAEDYERKKSYRFI
jgi:pyruvate kinase